MTRPLMPFPRAFAEQAAKAEEDPIRRAEALAALKYARYTEDPKWIGREHEFAAFFEREKYSQQTD